MTVACVLRSGGRFDVKDMLLLRSAVYEHAPEARFRCLTDFPWWRVIKDEHVPLEHDWPGWWSKIELFRPGLFDPDERIIYLDLDTVVCGSLDPLLEYDGPPACLIDLNRPDLRERIGSGVMTWRAGELTEIYASFSLIDPEATMRTYWARMDHYLVRWFRNLARIQEFVPESYVVSYKKHCRNRKNGEAVVPAGASLICFHGVPHPRDLASDDPVRVLWDGETRIA